MTTITNENEMILNHAHIAVQRATAKLNRMKSIGWFYMAKTNPTKQAAIDEQIQIKTSYQNLIQSLSK